MMGAEPHGRTGHSRCIVIVTYNSVADIGKCLSTLADEDVIVVDDASADRTDAIAAAHDVKTLIRNPVNRGFAAAANQAMCAAGEADVVLVNPDVQVTSETLDHLADTVTRSGAGLVAPRLTYPDDTDQESARAFPTFFHSSVAARHWTCLRRLAVARKRGSVGGDPRRVRGRLGDRGGDVPSAGIAHLTGGFDERGETTSTSVLPRGERASQSYWTLVRPPRHRYGRASKPTFHLRQPATGHHWASIFRLARRYPPTVSSSIDR